MGTIRIDVSNFVTISLVAFVGVWLINRGLTKFGLDVYKA